MNDSFSKASDIINNFFEVNDETKKVIQMLSAWSKIVSSISYNGPQLADHSRVVDYKNGSILVEADHSAWIQILQINKRYILTGLKRYMPQLEIKNIMFKLAGQQFTKTETKEPTRAELLDELNRKYAPLEEEVEKDYKKDDKKNVEMDEKLKELFDKLKNDIQSC
ncbi:MAG: DUF721 domain-containing protein [Treponemataceae bacterium]|nr:DUF721 domain-containing protein [Treponemataceae bacterium]